MKVSIAPSGYLPVAETLGRGSRWVRKFAGRRQSLRQRLDLILFALTRRYGDLPYPYQSIPPTFIEYGAANIFELLPQARTWRERPRREFAALCKFPGSNSQSSELDTVHLLYDLARMLRARRAIEVGVFQGAASLHLAQALADNGGGDLHLVELSAERLADVEAKIGRSGLAVRVCPHLGSSVTIARAGGLPQADLIYLDAEHQYDTFGEEFRGYWPLVTRGGLMVIHDAVAFDGVRRRANELHAAGHTVFTFASSQGAGVAVVKKS